MSIQGSSARSFGIAFVFIFCLGTALVYGGLLWAGGISYGPLFGAEVVTACAGMSVILARMVSFQVATVVTTSDRGVDASWHGPFGGRQSRSILWNEIRGVRVIGLSGTCAITTDSALRSIQVTLPQARAILRHPCFPLRDVPPRVRALIARPP